MFDCHCAGRPIQRIPLGNSFLMHNLAICFYCHMYVYTCVCAYVYVCHVCVKFYMYVATHDVFSLFNVMQMQRQSRVGDPPPAPLSLPRVPKKSPPHLLTWGWGGRGGRAVRWSMGRWRRTRVVQRKSQVSFCD